MSEQKERNKERKRKRSQMGENGLCMVQIMNLNVLLSFKVISSRWRLLSKRPG